VVVRKGYGGPGRFMGIRGVRFACECPAVGMFVCFRVCTAIVIIYIGVCVGIYLPVDFCCFCGWYCDVPFDSRYLMLFIP